MKVSYRREMKHNYLIIDPEELEWEGYESCMLAGNVVEGLLRFQVRQMDCGVQFYYEITSRQPLSRLTAGKGLRAEEIRRLLLGIFRALERMETYLLREERVLLEPEYLYVEPESFRVWLCVVPGLSRSFPDMLRELAEYLLGCVSREDKEGVVLAYGLYQETRRENYGLDDVMRLLYQDGTTDADRRQEADEQVAAGPGVTAERSEERMPVRGQRRKSEWRTDVEPVRRNAAEPVRRTIKTVQDELVRQDRLWERWKRWLQVRLGRPKAAQMPVQAPLEMLFCDAKEEPAVPAGEVHRTEANVRGERNIRGKANICREPDACREPGIRADIGKAPELGTVLLADLTDDGGTHMLRALDPGREDIEIPYYPFVIGKQENLVDYCLREDTVSRLHLRIDRDSEGCRIQDLNSTNGTCVCGQLLENNEAAELHIGDEVQIARCRYRFE